MLRTSLVFVGSISVLACAGQKPSPSTPEASVADLDVPSESSKPAEASIEAPTADDVKSEDHLTGAPSKSSPSEEAAKTEPVKPAEPTRPFVRLTEALFDEPFKSLKLSATVWVQSEPFADGDYLGMLGGGARPEYQSHVENDECPWPWIEIKPRGFICIKAKPSEKEPTRESDKAAKPMLGTYGIARKGAVFYRSIIDAETDAGSRPNRGDMIRLTRTVKTEDGRVFWRTQRGEFVEAALVGRLSGSKFKGIDLTADGGQRLPFAFAVNSKNKRGRGDIVVRDSASAEGRKIRKLKSKAIVELSEPSADGEFLKIGDNEWVARADLRLARTSSIPDDAGDDFWVDVDLDEQVIIVYKGKRPILATLGSSGRPKDATPTGEFRVTRKKRQTTMASDRSRQQSYSVAVPWPTYFHDGFAFHSAYWHDSFGIARSHGCINLSPTDALTIYSFLEPKLPAGWLSVFSHDSQPGSIVRLRAKVAVPVPPSTHDENAETEKKRRIAAKRAAKYEKSQRRRSKKR